MTRSTAIVLALLFFLTPVAHAQNPQRIDPNEMMRMMQDPAAMQKMAEEAKAAEQCLAKIEQADLDALERKARAAGDEIDRLCKAGKRDEAMKKALSLAREMNSNETLTTLRTCTKDLSETMKKMVPISIPDFDDDLEPNESDICS